MIWIVLYTFGLDLCLGKLMVDLVGISRVSRDLPITKCLIPGVPDNLTLGHIPAWGRHLPSLAFSRTKSTSNTCNAAKIHSLSFLSDLYPTLSMQLEAQLSLKVLWSVITTMLPKLRNAEQHRREMEIVFGGRILEPTALLPPSHKKPHPGTHWCSLSIAQVYIDYRVWMWKGWKNIYRWKIYWIFGRSFYSIIRQKIRPKMH